MSLGPLELVIILLIVIILFGRGRISGLAGEIGEAVSNFRKGVRDNSAEADAKKE